jgi:dihydropteroate synthase
MTIPSMTGMKSSFENNFFSTNKTLNLNGRLVDLRTPRIMGILNVTPDSFYDGNRYTSEADILKQVEKMLSDGAMFIDVGGYSTRPGAEEISAEEEQKRVLKAVKNISHEFPDAFISVDTFRSEVVRAAVDAGAHLVNDVSGGSLDDAMFKTVAELKVPYILMHMRGTPQTMNKLTVYENLLKDIMDFFHEKIFTLQQLGAKDIIVDPGFGFAKTVEQNFELLSKLDHFNILGKPVLAGTTSLNTVALLKGASLLRVHDVKQAAEAIKLIEKISTGHN